MSFPLESFEANLPAGMVRKGEAYWMDDTVRGLAFDGSQWEAFVYGSEKYTVRLSLFKDEVVDWSCDCPYDWGPICKHVIAVLFAIRESGSEIMERVALNQEDDSIKDRREVQKSALGPIAQIIEQMDEATLRESLHYLSQRHNDVSSHLLAKYAHLLPGTDRKHFKKLVKSIIHAHTQGRDGFIDYRHAHQLGEELLGLLGEQDSVAAGMSTVYLCQEVIRQLTKAMHDADDSSGSMGGAISVAYQILNDVAENETSTDVLEYLFEYATQEKSTPEYEEWGSADDLQVLAVKATRTQEQAQVLIEQLDSSIEAKSKEKYSQYPRERLANLKYKLLRQYYPSDEAEYFLQSNLAYTSFREMAIQAAIDEQKYEQAERLAEEGIQEDTINRFPGLVTKWKDCLLQIARITNDQEAQIKILEQLFFSNADMNDYRQLKALHTPAGFSKRIEEYIHHFRMREKQYFRGQPYFNERVANILQEENRLNELMEELLKSPELYRLDHYFTILSEQYTADYINAYDQAIRNEMKHSSDRKAYSNCCYYLQKMEKLGGMEQVAQIVTDWRQKYPRRRALLEELAKRRW